MHKKYSYRYGGARDHFQAATLINLAALSCKNRRPTLDTMIKPATGLNTHISVLADFREAEWSPEKIRGNLMRAVENAENKALKGWQAFINRTFTR